MSQTPAMLAVFGGADDCDHPMIRRIGGLARFECSGCGARFVPALDVYEQVDAGLLAEHDCPAIYALSAIMCTCIDGNDADENRLLELREVQ